MNASAFIDALGLPTNARVDQRVPKKLLVENGAPTPADKRQITEGIEELRWVAALKPTTIGVSEYRDAAREYLEIAVLSMTLRESANAGRLTELVHRAVPYPVWLVTTQTPKLTLSLAHKRWSQGEAGKTVLDGDLVMVSFTTENMEEMVSEFLDALALVKQPREHLRALYQGWIDCVTALAAARIRGVFALSASAEHTKSLRDSLVAIAQLQGDLARLRSQATKERQLNRLVDLNLRLKQLEAQLAKIISTLEPE